MQSNALKNTVEMCEVFVIIGITESMLGMLIDNGDYT